MKYILMCIAALAVCLGFSWMVVRFIGKKKKLSKRSSFFAMLGISLCFICGVMFGYLSKYYHADATAKFTSQSVQMEEIDGGYFFDGLGEDTALIFYPGAKVETLAYTPLMTALAEKGVDCFLADMPFRMAIFGSDIADKFLESYSYNHWICAGHSMGGLVISGYATEHEEQIEALVLLASYPGDKIPDSVSFCSIYGTKDGCLNMEAYKKAKEYWPKEASEFVIEGGNHAQYANYGQQDGDFEADCTREEQQKETVEIILEAVKE